MLYYNLLILNRLISFFFSLLQKQGPMDSSQRLFQCLVNKSSFLALTVILTFLNHGFPTSLEKKIKMVLKIVAVQTSIYHFEVILLRVITIYLHRLTKFDIHRVVMEVARELTNKITTKHNYARSNRKYQSVI